MFALLVAILLLVVGLYLIFVSWQTLETNTLLISEGCFILALLIKLISDYSKDTLTTLIAVLIGFAATCLLKYCEEHPISRRR